MPTQLVSTSGGATAVAQLGRLELPAGRMLPQCVAPRCTAPSSSFSPGPLCLAIQPRRCSSGVRQPPARLRARLRRIPQPAVRRAKRQHQRGGAHAGCQLDGLLRWVVGWGGMVWSVAAANWAWPAASCRCRRVRSGAAQCTSSNSEAGGCMPPGVHGAGGPNKPPAVTTARECCEVSSPPPLASRGGCQQQRWLHAN